MKMKYLEYLRLFLLCGYIGTGIVSNINPNIIQELETIMNNEELIEQTEMIFKIAYNTSFLTCFHLEELTKEYEELSTLYYHVLYNTAQLLEEFGCKDDPIKIFAMYIYLYRKGYLSKNKFFVYSTDMKDFPALNGIDVIRGTGVCRSISSMYTDICNVMGLTASNVAVKATSKCMNKKEKLSPVSLPKEPKSATFAKVVGTTTSILPIGNHLVTAINHPTMGGIYDPTNDILMHAKTRTKYTFLNDETAYMKYNIPSSIIPTIFGQMELEINPKELTRLRDLPKISYEDYKKSYQEAIELISSKEEVLELFFHTNKPFYDEIDRISSHQNDMIKRLIPIIPSTKK